MESGFCHIPTLSKGHRWRMRAGWARFRRRMPASVRRKHVRCRFRVPSAAPSARMTAHAFHHGLSSSPIPARAGTEPARARRQGGGLAADDAAMVRLRGAWLPPPGARSGPLRPGSRARGGSCGARRDHRRGSGPRTPAAGASSRAPGSSSAATASAAAARRRRRRGGVRRIGRDGHDAARRARRSPRRLRPREGHRRQRRARRARPSRPAAPSTADAALPSREARALTTRVDARAPRRYSLASRSS